MCSPSQKWAACSPRSSEVGIRTAHAILLPEFQWRRLGILLDDDHGISTQEDSVSSAVEWFDRTQWMGLDRMNAGLSFLYHLWVNRPDRWYPLLGVYYLTYACDFRCPYCSDGQRKPYYRLPEPALAATGTLEVLAAMRRSCDHVVITGGEPLQHPEFSIVMSGIKALGFGSVILTTNGYKLDELCSPLPASVTHLVISLDTLDHAKADRWHGVGTGSLQRILANLDRCARARRRGLQIIISAVVTPENLPDLYAVYQYCRERRFRFAACPQLVGVKAHAGLSQDSAYRDFYQFLIAEKKQGRRVQGTVEYLESMRDLRQFACRPFTMLVVSPSGEVSYPCLELGHFAGNLRLEPDLHRIRRLGFERFGGQPRCGSQCHSACALGFATLLERPLSAVREACLMAKGWLRGF